MIRVLVVDDQPLVRAGAVAVIDAAPDLAVVGEAADGAQALSVQRERRADVVVLDVRMPVMDGIETTARLLDASMPPCRVLVLTTFDLDEYVYAALRAGAAGFLLKDAPTEDLLAAVRTVHRGDAVIAPSATRRLLAEVVPALPDVAARDRALAGLTERERDVVVLLADGLSNAEIGARTYLSEATVKTHVGRVLAKLGLRDRVQVVVWAYRNGLVRP
ncbi:response regulator [Cellulosimicrobium cellulans]|uniref:DNA-binding response regulator n=1 Tax=Cellulosimicrobium cellulans TaxID=1710 RepID=A0A4Y4E6R3_CELCE|nr:response regulator transcription factor [Cellulosimicrobium cellulans]GED11634.1 DNA-binding response regulator [Cellulosimicrobium cellulans]